MKPFPCNYLIAGVLIVAGMLAEQLWLSALILLCAAANAILGANEQSRY